MLDPVTAGIIASTAGKAIEPIMEMGSYYLGDLIGYNDKLSKDQLKQYDKQLAIQQGYNLEAMQQQLKNQQAMYDYTYSKTTPAQQVENLKKAGLNPAMALGMPAMGQGQTGSSAALGAGASGLESIASMRGKQAKQFELTQMMQVQNQIKATEAEIKLKEAQARNLDADTANKPKEGRKIESDIDLTNVQTGNARLDGELKSLQIEYDKVRNEIKSSTSEWEIQRVMEDLWEKQADVDIKSADARIKKRLENTIVEQGKLALQESIKMLALLDSQINLTDEQANKVTEEILNLAVARNQMSQQIWNDRVKTIAYAAGVGIQAVEQAVGLILKGGFLKSYKKSVDQKGGTQTNDIPAMGEINLP